MKSYWSGISILFPILTGTVESVQKISALQGGLPEGYSVLYDAERYRGSDRGGCVYWPVAFLYHTPEHLGVHPSLLEWYINTFSYFDRYGGVCTEDLRPTRRPSRGVVGVFRLFRLQYGLYWGPHIVDPSEQAP